jgi:hypothetical protein
MTHLFKVPLQNSDVFIRNITDSTIEYSVYEKGGKLLEPVSVTDYEIKEGKVYFGSKFIPEDYFEYIKQVLE